MKSRQEIFFEDVEPIISEIISKINAELSPEFCEEIRKAIQATLWNNTLNYEISFQLNPNMADEDLDRGYELMTGEIEKRFLRDIQEDPWKLLQQRYTHDNEDGFRVFTTRIRALRLPR